MMRAQHSLSGQAQASLAFARSMLRTMRPARPARTVDPADDDKYSRFYRSRAWRAARYQFLKNLKPGERRCAACGATAADDRLVVDHVLPIKTEQGWRQRLTGPFQILCNTDNLAKASHDTTNFRTDAVRADEGQRP